MLEYVGGLGNLDVCEQRLVRVVAYSVCAYLSLSLSLSLSLC